MKSPVFWSLGVVFAVGLLSGCGENDTASMITPSGPTASVEDQRTPESDELTSEEAALVSLADSEPDQAPRSDS